MNQLQLPQARPRLDCFLSRNCLVDARVGLGINELVTILLSAELRSGAILVLPHARGKIGCDAGIEDAMGFVAHHVDVTAAHGRKLACNLAEMPAFAGMTPSRQ